MVLFHCIVSTINYTPRTKSTSSCTLSNVEFSNQFSSSGVLLIFVTTSIVLCICIRSAAYPLSGGVTISVVQSESISCGAGYQ